MYRLEMELHTLCKHNACKVIYLKYHEFIVNMIKMYQKQCIEYYLRTFSVTIYFIITELIVSRLVDQAPDKILHQPSVEPTLESIVSLMY